MRTTQKIGTGKDGRKRCGIFWTLALVGLCAIAISQTPAFADISPAQTTVAQSGHADDSRIQLAEGSLPAMGGIDDYMHQQGDGPTTSPPAQGYAPQNVPPPPSYGYQNYGPQSGYNGYPQGSYPSREFNNGYGNADPNAQRNLPIGAAVVGAVMVGMWAIQQHQNQQAERRAHKQYRRQYHGFAN